MGNSAATTTYYDASAFDSGRSSDPPNKYKQYFDAKAVEWGVETRGFWRGLGNGAIAGGESSLEFLESLATIEGWSNLGKGFLALATLNSQGGDGMIARSRVAQSVSDIAQEIPNMNSYQIGFGVGYGTEKLVEGIILSKGAGLALNSIRGSSIGRVLWVGGGTGGVAQKAAQAFALEKGLITVDMTWYGRFREYISPFLSKRMQSKMWDGLSYVFARRARGEVYTFFGRKSMYALDKTGNFIQNSVWYRIEYPTLLKKGIDYIPKSAF